MKWVSITLFFLILKFIPISAYGVLAGGRPNAISGGQNSFAGIINPANAVWIQDRIDVGCYLVYQKISLDNRDNNPRFSLGKTNQTYKSNFLHTGDIAIHKRMNVNAHDFSITLATYATPNYIKLRTKEPVPVTGTTPIHIKDRTQVISSIFSLKLSENHSIGLSLDYFYLSHRRDGFQNADNPLRSVSPGHVTNRGMDHSNGFGLSLGWRWNITKSLDFGFAFVKKSYVGQFRKYRGYEPHHARNYIPQTLGAGFTYHFNKHLAGRVEVLWTGFGSLPNANNAITSKGVLNTHKRGSNKSSGSGLQDATVINAGIGYKVNESLSFGTGYSHRIKLPRKSPYILSHSYLRQTIFNLITCGANFNFSKNDFYLTYTHGFPTRISGIMPEHIGGGKFVARKNFDALSLAWGYLY